MGIDARSGGFSAGHTTLGLVWASAVRRSSLAGPDGGRQMRAFDPDEADSLSRARKAMEGAPDMSLRACLSLISSGIIMRTALGRKAS